MNSFDLPDLTGWVEVPESIREIPANTPFVIYRHPAGDLTYYRYGAKTPKTVMRGSWDGDIKTWFVEKPFWPDPMDEFDLSDRVLILPDVTCVDGFEIRVVWNNESKSWVMLDKRLVQFHSLSSIAALHSAATIQFYSEDS